MTTSTPPAWKWRDECDAPVETTELSIPPRKLPDSDALCERNGSGTEPEVSSSTTRKLDTDPTGEDAWPLERAVSTNAIGACCADPCESTAQMANAQSNAAPSHRIGTCYLDPDTGETVTPADFFGEKELRWRTDKTTAPETTSPADSCVEHRHRSNFYGGYLLAGVTDPPQCPVCLREMENDEGILCESCGEPTGPGSFAVVNGPGGVFVFHLRCYDEVYWGEDMDTDVDEGLISGDGESVPCGQRVGEDGICGYWSGGQEIPERETCSVEETPLWHPAEVADKMADTFDVPFPVQSWTFEALIELEVDHLHEIIDDHHDEIVKMARRRHRTGHVLHGSKGYQWDAKTRLRNVLEELSDGGTYLTMGSIE